MRNFLRIFVAAAALTATTMFGSVAQTGPVFLNNYDSNHGIFAPGGALATTAFVQLFVGTSSSDLTLVTSSTGQSTFSLVEPGFFDNGFAYTGFANSSSAYFRLVAWNNGADFASATVKGSVDWTQTVGVQQPGSPLLPPPQQAVLANPVLNMSLAAVPEPTTIALGVMGGMALLARRRRNAA